MKLDFNQLFLPLYRMISLFSMLVIFVAAILYAFLVGFFLVSTSWATPQVLSPSQEKVLSYQPQVAALQTRLTEQEVALATFQLEHDSKIETLRENRKLLERFGQAKDLEVSYFKKAGLAPAGNVSDNKSDTRWLLERIQNEQKAGLLTKYDAYRELTAVNKAALSSGEQKEQLRASVAQLEIDIQTSEMSIQSLNKTLADGRRILDVAKDSPKYKALKNPVTVAFVPYSNLRHAEADAPVYKCHLRVFLCYKVGTVKKVYDAEEYAAHPMFNTDLKGRLIDVEYADIEASESSIVFLGGRPLLL